MSRSLSLNLAPVKSATIASHQEEIEATYAPARVVLVLPAPYHKEISIPCSLGEALVYFIERLVDEYGFDERTLRFFLERREQSCYMMDPLSLNDFPRARELALQGQPIRILVDGQPRQ